MTRLFTLLFSFITFFSAQGQTFKRLDNETAEKFVLRVTNVGNLVYPIIQTKEWTVSNVIIAFIPTGDEITVGLMFVKKNGSTYKQILIDSFSTFGNTAKIDTVFFANANSDKTKELIIMTTYGQSHGKEIGVVYWNLIFDKPDFINLPDKLKYLKKTSKKIDGSYEGMLNGQMKHSKFKNAADIKTELQKLGY